VAEPSCGVANEPSIGTPPKLTRDSLALSIKSEKDIPESFFGYPIPHSPYRMMINSRVNTRQPGYWALSYFATHDMELEEPFG